MERSSRISSANSLATLAIPAALLTLTLTTDLFRWATIGLETVLLTAVFLYLTVRLLQERPQPSPRTFLLIGLLGLIRADGLVYGVTLCLLAWLLSDNKRRVWQLAPLILIFPSAHLLFRLTYYGDFFPNTYHLKLTGWADRWQAGWEYIGRFMGQYGWAWVIAGSVGLQRAKDGQGERFRLGHWRLWRTRHDALRPLWLLGLPLFAYAIYTGGDDFSGLRFLAPWLPILLALLFLWPGALRWRGWPLPSHIHLLLLALFALLILLRSSYIFFRTPPADEQLFLQAGLMLREHTPPETRIGVFWAGALPYFAERPSTDMLGKNDAALARQPAFPGSDKPGHNKFNYDYSLGQRHPDLLVAPVHPAVIASAENLARYSTGNDAYVGQLYQNPVFQTEYAANLIFIGEVPIFVRRDSDLVTLLMNGRCQTFTNDTLLQLGLVEACWPFEE
jgi:hypothetical protein